MQPTAQPLRAGSCFEGCVQIATDAQNPHPRILRTCHRSKPQRLDKPKSHQMSKSRWGEFWTSDTPASKCLTNFAPPEESFVPPPGRNSVNFAPPPRANSEPGNDLRERAGAKFAEFRPTRKRKNFTGAKTLFPKPLATQLGRDQTCCASK